MNAEELSDGLASLFLNSEWFRKTESKKAKKRRKSMRPVPFRMEVSDQLFPALSAFCILLRVEKKEGVDPFYQVFVYSRKEVMEYLEQKSDPDFAQRFSEISGVTGYPEYRME